MEENGDGSEGEERERETAGGSRRTPAAVPATTTVRTEGLFGSDIFFQDLKVGILSSQNGNITHLGVFWEGLDTTIPTLRYLYS